MLAILILAVFALCFVVVVSVIAAGSHFAAPKALDVSVRAATDLDEEAPAMTGPSEQIDFDWLRPVNAPGLLDEESLSTISIWDSLLARFDGIAIVKQQLAQSGMRWTVGRLTSMMMLSGAATFAILWKMSWAGLPLVFSLSLAAAAGPYLMMLRRRAKRLAKIEEQFPEALDSLARSVRSGNALSAALELLARESPQPLAAELRRTANQRTLGGNWDQALEGLARRVPVAEVSVFVGALQLQSRAGGKLHEVLGKLAETMRESAALKSEVRSIAAHGKLTGGILTVLPLVIACIMSYVNPQQMLMLWNDPIGHRLIWASLGCLILAHVVIRKLVDIRI
jgi:tight adherence protein B